MTHLVRHGLGLAVAALALSAGVPASAQSTPAVFVDDHNGAREIAAGDYGRAERVLLTSLSTSPTDPDLLLNLAALYAHGGRASEAKALYRKVLARPDESLVVGDQRSVSSHAMAQAALKRFDAVQLTAR